MRALAATLAFLPALALASEEFPPAIDDHLDLGYEPVCTICHETLAGGFGTAIKPLALKMRQRGLVAGDLDSLRTALDALAAEGSDVDEDGVGDIQELQDGTDPNSAAGLDDPPEYGCLGSVAPTSPRRAWPGAVLALGAAIVALRRRALFEGRRTPGRSAAAAQDRLQVL